MMERPLGGRTTPGLSRPRGVPAGFRSGKIPSAGALSRAAVPCLLLCLLSAFPSVGAIKAEATISANQVGTGEPFQLVVSVSADSAGELPWPEVGNLGPFQVRKERSTSQSSQTTIINGRISQDTRYVTTFTYTLTAPRPGTFPLGPIRYRHGAFDRNLGSATVRVEKREPGIRLQPSLSSRRAYLGEQLLYNLRIIPGPGVQKISRPEIQKLIGEKFWFRHLDEKIEAKVVNLDGRDTRLFDVRIVLFPLLDGPVELPGIPVEYEQAVRSRRRPGSVFDFFEEDFFGGQVLNLTATSDPLSLAVRPLPQGAPAGFSGAVGRFSLEASTDKRELPAGDALTLTVTVKGDGQPGSIRRPVLPDLDPFEVYEPEVSEKSNVRASTLWTTKTFKYVLVPKRRGDYTIGAIRFPYFDPDAKGYTSAASRPLEVSVAPGRESARPGAMAASQREIAELGSDIRHIKSPAGPLTMENDFLYRRAWFWALFLIPPAGYLALAGYRRRAARLESDANLRRRLRAGGELKRRLGEARKAQEHKDGAGFYQALAFAVQGFAGDKLGVEFRGLLLDEARRRLKERGAGDGTVAKYDELMQRCDFGRFGGGDRDEQAWNRALEEAVSLLKRMDKELKP